MKNILTEALVNSATNASFIFLVMQILQKLKVYMLNVISIKENEKKFFKKKNCK